MLGIKWRIGIAKKDFSNLENIVIVKCKWAPILIFGTSEEKRNIQGKNI